MTAPQEAPEVPRAGRWATALVFSLTIAMLATWLPHYLTWPWWPDADAWATIAQGWDAGIKPYRDVVIFNFPGQIYEAWILGKAFGWGRTMPFYALDAALLVALGPLLTTWSRRRFGNALAGGLAWATVLAIYANLDYAMVAQRDWQGPLLAVMGLLVIQRWPGRAGRLISSGMLAAGFVIRPHVVLFLPVVGMVLVWDRPAGESWRGTLLRLIEWGVAFALFVALALAPLVAQGLIGDFVAGVRQASYGRGYGKATVGSVAEGVVRQLGLLEPARAFATWADFVGHLDGWKVLATIVAIAILLALAPPERRRPAAPWAVLLMMALLYEPLHPKRHGYLALPLKLAWAMGWGVLAGLLLDRWAARRGVWKLTFLVLLLVAIPGVPRYCRPLDALNAVLGRASSRVPATAEAHFYPGDPNTPYRWEDYRQALAYLRQHTGPETRVATALRNVPFPPFNGVLGRVTPLPAESGVIWLWSVNPKLEGAFVEALERSPSDTVVVWAPDESTFDTRLELPELRSAIRRLFRPEARFGMMQVWTKRPAPR